MFLILSLVSTYVNKNRFFIIHRTLYIRLHDGGYWAADGSYNGGETRCCRVDFENPNLKMLLDMLSSGGFPENMSKLSYFPSGIVDQNKKDLCSHIDVAEMLTFSSELESMNLYVVRADDPFLDDVLVGGDEEEEEPESDGEWADFYKDDYDDEGGKIEFFVGQTFVSKEKCRETIEKFVVKEKVDIHFQRSERKKVGVVCVAENCQWRLYASINSRSDNMVVRSYIGNHSFYHSRTTSFGIFKSL